MSSNCKTEKACFFFLSKSHHADISSKGPPATIWPVTPCRGVAGGGVAGIFDGHTFSGLPGSMQHSMFSNNHTMKQVILVTGKETRTVQFLLSNFLYIHSRQLV